MRNKNSDTIHSLICASYKCLLSVNSWPFSVLGVGDMANKTKFLYSMNLYSNDGKHAELQVKSGSYIIVASSKCYEENKTA